MIHLRYTIDIIEDNKGEQPLCLSDINDIVLEGLAKYGFEVERIDSVMFREPVKYLVRKKEKKDENIPGGT